MVVRAKGYTFPYLFDENQKVYKEYGAKRTPNVFLLQNEGNDLIVSYIGAIDDNYQDESKVTNPYLANTIDALMTGRTPDPTFTKAIGCVIKDKDKKQ